MDRGREVWGWGASSPHTLRAGAERINVLLKIMPAASICQWAIIGQSVAQLLRVSSAPLSPPGNRALP